MALQPIVASYDGPQITVRELVKYPRILPRRILSLMENQFMVDTVLRRGGDAPGGVVAYHESTPLFPREAGDAPIKAEFAEYPILTASEGVLKSVVAVNRGASVLVSEEMRRRNTMDRVNIQITQLRNLMVRTFDNAFRVAVTGNTSVPTLAATAAWSSGATAKIRNDILEAIELVQLAADANQTDNYFGYLPDTLVMSYATATEVLKNTEFADVYKDDLARENVRYTGKLPRQILGLDVLRSWSWPNNEVLVCQRGVLGFIADERSLRSTPLYEDPPRETWRSDTSRISAVGVDQPKAAVRITGV